MRDWVGKIHQGDALDMLRRMPDESVQCVVTSPPYWGLRDYGVSGQMDLEKSPEEYLAGMVRVFGEVRRVLREDGTLWLNMGDSYANDDKWGGSTGGKHANGLHGKTGIGRQKTQTGLKPKNLYGMPWRLALALQADGWWLRADIIWHKPNPMPESVTDRPTKAHEYMFLMTKAARYYYDAEAVKEAGLADTEARYERGRGANPKNADGGPGNQTIATSLEHMRQKVDKQRGHGRRHDGFNDRWDAMPREEQCGMGRNKRDVWTIATQANPDSHFATFPERLVEPCVLAGTSEYGACRECGAPWARMVETQKAQTRNSRPSGPYAERRDTATKRDHLAMVTTTGWRRTCKCECVDVVPCVVLDPFAGTGTALRVAQRLGRGWVGIELNPEYIGMALPRLAQGVLL